MATINPDSIPRWKRTIGYLERVLERVDGGVYSRADGKLNDATQTPRPTLVRMPSQAQNPAQRREIHTALMIDAMCWAFEQLIDGETVHAFRGTLLAREHAAHAGYNPVTKDASIELQNAIEDALTGRW